MIPLKDLQARFLKDPVPVRLGGIASDLARLASLASKDMDDPSFQNILREIKLFTEWTAESLDLKKQEQILMLQRAIVHLNPRAIHKQASQWSEKILSLSGLCEK